MSRFGRFTPISLGSFAAYLLLAACGDAGDGSSANPDGSSAGSSHAPAGGALNAAGSANGVPNMPGAGQATSGGASGAGAGTGGTSNGAGGIAMGGVGTSAGTGGAATAGAATGGMGGRAGSGTGGAPGGSGTGGKGGTSSGGSGTGGKGGTSSGGSGGTGGTASGTSCSSITDFGVVAATIVVKNGETYDGKCRRYRADPNTLGDGTQAEDQKPVFVVENGGKLINVVLGAPAADGIHTEGNVTLENITWEDIGEDAMTIKEAGTVILNGGSAKNGDDKVFQINAAATFRVSNFKASNAGKFIRQNGDTTFKVQVFIDKCDISDMDEAIFRTDSSTSTVSMTNTRYHAIGDSNFIGVASGNITQSNNTAY
jgi:hypothetical protein